MFSTPCYPSPGYDSGVQPSLHQNLNHSPAGSYMTECHPQVPAEWSGGYPNEQAINHKGSVFTHRLVFLSLFFRNVWECGCAFVCVCAHFRGIYTCLTICTRKALPASQICAIKVHTVDSKERKGLEYDSEYFLFRSVLSKLSPRLFFLSKSIIRNN